MFTKHGWRVIIFPYVPTAENLARWIYEQIKEEIELSTSGLHVWLDGITVYETPNSRAIYRPIHDISHTIATHDPWSE
jgi:6-pyruvoyl-tetrahydropterin synthase